MPPDDDIPIAPDDEPPTMSLPVDLFCPAVEDRPTVPDADVLGVAVFDFGVVVKSFPFLAPEEDEEEVCATASVAALARLAISMVDTNTFFNDMGFSP